LLLYCVSRLLFPSRHSSIVFYFSWDKDLVPVMSHFLSYALVFQMICLQELDLDSLTDVLCHGQHTENLLLFFMDAMMWDLTVKAGDLFRFPGAEHGPGSALVPFTWHLKSSICPVLQRQHRDNLGLLFSLWLCVSRIWMGYSRLCLVCVILIPFGFNVVCSTPESHMISQFVWLLPTVQTIDICFSFMLAWTTPRACHLYDCNHMGVMHMCMELFMFSFCLRCTHCTLLRLCFFISESDSPL
jgi:hypothetical protein